MNLDLTPLQTAKTVWVAYSGGLDSHVLLHVLKQQQIHIHAVHVHHGLSKNADAWQQHCEKTCKALGIPCETLKVHAYPEPGESPEAAARTARYAAFASLLNEGDYLVTAHHQNDQAETFLLQLLRGAGLKGLASMPVLAPFAKGMLFRPLLNTTRAELLAYATEHQLQWVNDESNEKYEFDRNYLRHELLPKFLSRWPATLEVFARSANHCAEALQLLDLYAEQDLNNLLAEAKTRPPQTLPITPLLKLAPERQRHVLRYWLRSLGFPVPSTLQMQHVQTDLLNSAEDANPVICFGNIKLCRFRDDLYVMPSEAAEKINYADLSIPFDLNSPLQLPEGLGQLSVCWEEGRGSRALSQAEQNALHIRFRRGGERCHPAGRVGSHPLNKLFQEWKVAPWLRDKIPLIYTGNELISVLGYCFTETFSVKSGEEGWHLRWDV